jgi:hypothetical protein
MLKKFDFQLISPPEIIIESSAFSISGLTFSFKQNGGAIVIDIKVKIVSFSLK